LPWHDHWARAGGVNDELLEVVHRLFTDGWSGGFAVTAQWVVDFSPKRCKVVQMRRSVDLDPELEAELSDVVSLTKEKAAVVIRQALRAGLPAVANRFHSPRPAGYFAGDYGPDQERVALESAMSKIRQKPER